MVPAARSARWRPASSTRAPTSARSSRRWRCRGSRSRGAGSWAFIITGALGFLWLGGVAWRCTARRASIHGCRRRSSPTSKAIRSNPCSPSRGPVASAPADVGVRGRQVHDGSDLVAVSLLGAGFPPQGAPHRPEGQRAADLRHLPDRDDRQRRRRVAAGAPAERGLDAEPARKTAMLVPACACCRSCSRRSSASMWAAVVLIGLAAVGAPGVVGESLHVLVGHVPQARRGIGRRASAAWRGAVGGMFIALVGRPDPAGDRAATCRSS